MGLVFVGRGDRGRCTDFGEREEGDDGLVDFGTVEDTTAGQKNENFGLRHRGNLGKEESRRKE
jgi:hypothetical protein